MSDRRIHPTTLVGDPFHAARVRELREMEDTLAHELLDVDEREELRDRIIRLRRRLSLGGEGRG